MVNITNVASYEQDSHYKHLELNYQVGNAFHAAIRISRKSNMYVINSFSLVFIVTGLTFTSFVDSPEFANNRNKSLFSLLLTLFAYKITVSAQLPSVSYLTLIDKYMLLSILFTGNIQPSFHCQLSANFLSTIDVNDCRLAGCVERSIGWAEPYRGDCEKYRPDCILRVYCRIRVHPRVCRDHDRPSSDEDNEVEQRGHGECTASQAPFL